MTFLPVDYFFCIVILIFALIALSKGFLAEIFGKAAWVLGIIGAVFFYKKVASPLAVKIQNQLVCTVLAFLIVFVVFLLVKICEMILEKLFQLSLLKSLDRALGLMFGLVEGFAIVCLLIFILTVQPFVDTSSLLNGSFFVNLMGVVFASPIFQKNGGKV